MASNPNLRSGWVKAEAAKRARERARLDAADPQVHPYKKVQQDGCSPHGVC
jgi:hypothetical protein